MGQTIEIVRGTTNTLKIEVTDADGNAYNLEDGEKILFGVKKDAKDEALVIRKTVTQLYDGYCTIDLAPADTIGLEYGRYVYDVGLQSGNDYHNIIPVSALVIQPNITKWGDST